MKLKIVLFLLLMTSLCHADDYSWQCQDYYVYSEENGDCEPTLLFLNDDFDNTVINNPIISISSATPSPNTWVTIQGKHERIEVYCMDKGFNWNKDQCNNIRIIRHGLVMEK